MVNKESFLLTESNKYMHTKKLPDKKMKKWRTTYVRFAVQKSVDVIYDKLPVNFEQIERFKFFFISTRTQIYSVFCCTISVNSLKNVSKLLPFWRQHKLRDLTEV